MPLQNRVDPFGELHAVDARGLLMGNRGGRFHRDDKTLGARRHVSRRWIACVCEFRNRHRDVWGAGYTELFFLDEVTALAAGHRPCFECRRADAKAFMELFPFAKGESANVDTMDRRLGAERRAGRGKRTWRAHIADLPNGAMFVSGRRACVLSSGTPLCWSHSGYSAAARADGEVDVLTPPSIAAVLERGYKPLWHGGAGLFPR